MSVREMESAWVGTKKPVPNPVRAMWFLSSVLVNWRKLYSRELKKATGENGTEDDVVESLTLLVGIGRTARVLLDEMKSA
jgi:hypothetical protein